MVLLFSKTTSLWVSCGNIDTICHLIVTDKLKNAIVSIPSPFNENEFIDIDINIHKKTDTTFYLINFAPYIDISVYINASILSNSNRINYTNPDNIQLINYSLQTYLKENISAYLYKTSKEFASDIAGFGKYAKVNYMTLEEWQKSNWLDNYSNSFFNVNVYTNIQNSSLYNRF